MVSIIAGSNEAGVRLDRILRKRLPLLSLSRIYSLVRTGLVKVNGRKTKQDYRLIEGDTVEIKVAEAELAHPEKKPVDRLKQITLTEYFKRNFIILYEDKDLLACNKPSGLVVHPGTGHTRQDTLIDLAMAYLFTQKKISSDDEPALIHRLDRDTSGVILIAKNKPTVRLCHESFRERDLQKIYAAVCHNKLPKPKGEIVLNLGRDRDEQGETIMRVDERGQYSRSVYQVEAQDRGISRVEVELETGRTHQIRVHLAHLKAPIIGDTRYGSKAMDEDVFTRIPDCSRRLYLHSLRLELPHPVTGRTLTIKAPLPDDFKKIMNDPVDIASNK